MTPNTAPPATHADVLAHYTALRAQHLKTLDAARGRRTRAVQLLGLALLVIAWLTFGGLHAGAQAMPLMVAFVAVATLLWYIVDASPGIARRQRLLMFYERSLTRVDGSEAQSGRTGLEAGHELRVPGHLYEHDLDLLGPDSLFGLLATVRTGPGERGLAKLLLEPATYEETVQRQEAVKELLPQTELRERIALLGTSTFQQVSARFFDEWLDVPAPVFPAFARPVLAVTALIAVGLLLSALTHILLWGTVLPNLALDLLIQGSVCLWLRSRVVPLLERGVRLQMPVQLIAQGLALMDGATVHSAKLQALQKAAREPAGAVKALSQLESQLAIVEQRPKEYFLLFSLLLAAGTQAAISMATWKRRHADSMRMWLAAWSEFEALNAVGAYAFEHPEDAWPELLPASAAPHYEADGLGHPLLEGAVRNDILLDGANRFYLISGSNMAGKSTLLRAIGINAVLAYAGAPVRARGLRLTPLALGASLALTDSLAEGKSKFKAEVERLAAVARGSEERPMLFLVDEIFSGTNSADRYMAGSAVLSALLRHGAIGALSTHDLALTELATAANGGQNVHMASPDAADPLAFDYTLKPGVNTSSNALAIIRMMGLSANTDTTDRDG